ncbi:hypothetical protein [Halococcus sp. IIIV-5B]|uniref:hypothetical protein n=1 Tax=Halococcus sp. IIIV-5B TaxID=2321230 RepID=UPI000E75B38F|nr:hypothetical protein [Halococcus sp. IIIV-5B]RJS96300.1 hypothetical protein D3261_19205 [Halococcus sp. IIIV-5B]
MSRQILLGASVVSVTVGVALLVRPATTDRHRDVGSLAGASVPGTFGTATTRLNGVVLVLVGLVLLVSSLTD